MQFLEISVGQEKLVLHGPGKPGLLRGCLRRPTEAVNQERCREQLDVVLEGNQTSTQQFITQLQSLLTHIQAGQTAVLTIRPSGDAPLYESRLLGGQFTWLVGSVQPRGIGLRLELERENFWQLPWMGLPLSNGYAKDTLLPLLIDNRSDQFGENVVFSSSAVLPGDLPAPLRLLVVNDQGGGVNIRHLYVGMLWGESAALALEGEAALPDPDLGVVIDPACQGGAYAQKQGSAGSAQCLFRWLIGADDWLALAGKTLFPLIRLKTLAPPDLWVWWQVYQGGLVQASMEEYLSTHHFVYPLPRFHFPLVPDGFSSGGDVRLELWGQLAVGESFSLALDAVQLLGDAGWLAASPLPEGTQLPGETLVIDSCAGLAFCRTEENQALRASHQISGNGLWLLPNQAACFGFVFDETDGCFPEKQVRIQLQVRPRVRVLP